MAHRLPSLVLLVALACGEGPSGAGPDAAPQDADRDAASAADAGVRDAGVWDAGVRDAGVRDEGAEGPSPGDASADAPPADAGSGDCEDGRRNGDESDVDCGGRCGACANGAACAGDPDCLSDRCVDAVCRSPEGTHPDIVRVLDVPGRNPGGRSWADSYSVGGECYCASSFDHGIGPIEVPTPSGTRTVREVCDALGPGPGLEGRPLYNDVQCGNGPPNDAGDEDDCPGRVDIGREGCGHVGPRWNLSRL